MPFTVAPSWPWAPTTVAGQLRAAFTGADGDITTAGRTDLTWVALDGAGQITSNQSTGTSAFDLDVFRCATALPTADQVVEIDVTALDASNDRSAGLWLRMGSGAALEGYQVEINEQNDRYTIVRWVAGTGTNISGGFGDLAEPLTLPVTLPVTLRAEMTGTALTVYLGESLIWQGTDATPALAGNTRVGFSFYNANSIGTITEFRASEPGAVTIDVDTIAITSALPDPAVIVGLDAVPGLIARWVADDLDAALDAGDPVGSWAPRPGAVEIGPLAAAGTVRPTFAPAAAGGHDAVRFDRAAGQYLDTGAWTYTYGTPLTVLAVWRPATLEARMDVWSGRGTTYVHGSATPARFTAGAGADGELENPTTITPGRWHVVGAVYDGSASSIFWDALTATAAGTTSTQAANPQAALAGLHLGANPQGFGAYLDGWVAEVLVIDRVVGAAEMSGLLGELATTYGLSWAPPADSGPPDPPDPGTGGPPAGDPQPTPMTDAPIPRIAVAFDSGPESAITTPLLDEVAPYSTMEVTSADQLAPTYLRGDDTDLAVTAELPLAGTRSLTMTRTVGTGAGTIGWWATFNIAGVDLTGRTYLFWLPIRPAAGGLNRVVHVTDDYLDADGEALAYTTHTQTEGDGYVDGRGYTWIGVLSLVGPVRPRFLRLSVAVEDVEPGELHHVDAWSVRYWGTEISGRLRDRPGERRGRADDLATFEAGTGSLLLKNDDGQLTPGGAGYPVDLRQQIIMLWEWQGHLYPHFVGYTTEWESAPYLDGIGDVRVSFKDALDALSIRKIWPPHQSYILRDNPNGYLPLHEPSGSTAAGSIAGAGGTAVLRAGVAGSGGSDFCGQSFEPVHNSGHTGDGDATCLTFNPDATGTLGDVLDCSAILGALPARGIPWTWTLRFAAVSTDVTRVIWRTSVAQYYDLLTAFQIEQYSDNRLRVVCWQYSSYEVVITTQRTYGTDSPWTLELQYDPFAQGYGYGTVRLRIGIESITRVLTGDPWYPGTPDRAYLGGVLTSSSGGGVTFPWKARAAHLVGLC